jgi:hypothetical protein
VFNYLRTEAQQPGYQPSGSFRAGGRKERCSMLNLARSIAAASGHTLRCYVVSEPDDEEWAWNDVLPVFNYLRTEAQQPGYQPSGSFRAGGRKERCSI